MVVVVYCNIKVSHLTSASKLLLSVSPEKKGFVSHVQPEQVLLQRVELDTAVLHPQVRDWGVVDDCEPSSPGSRRWNREKKRKSKTMTEACRQRTQWCNSTRKNRGL